MQFVHLATMAAFRSDSYGVYWSARHYAARHLWLTVIAGGIGAGLGGYHAGMNTGFGLGQPLHGVWLLMATSKPDTAIACHAPRAL